MRSRLELHNQLKAITDHVYFQPPDNYELDYPCIVYAISDKTDIFANDSLFSSYVSYNVTYITEDPEAVELILTEFQDIRYSKFDSLSVTEGLYHLYYTIHNQ